MDPQTTLITGISAIAAGILLVFLAKMSEDGLCAIGAFLCFIIGSLFTLAGLNGLNII